MEYVEGQNLEQILTVRGPIPEGEAVDWVMQVCEALEYLHRQKPPVIHRDIKPQNIILTPQGRAVLVDFGVAKVYQAHLQTTMGARAVTPGFSPPEQYMLTGTDASSDIYSLGATLYTLLTGVIPPEAMARLLGEGLTPIRQKYPAITEPIETAVQKAMDLQKADRFASAGEMRNALHNEKLSTPIQTAPASTVLPSKQYATSPGMSATVHVGGTPATLDFKKGLSRQLKRVLAGVGVGLAALVLLIVGVNSGFEMNPPAAVPQPINTKISPTMTKISPTMTKIPSTPTVSWGVGSTQISPKDGMVMVYVPAGEFSMGSYDGYSFEQPVHLVYLDAYWIDQTEVTNGMYEKCVNGGTCTPPDDFRSVTRGSYYGNSQYADYPVVYVNWDQAKSYCEWAGRSLPTEAQWEKAARGTDGRTYPWGNDSPSRNLANYDVQVGDTTAAGAYPAGASPYGAYDMAGNVWEWVLDWYGAYPSGTVINPTGPASGEYRVLRGGSWNFTENSIRSANRCGDDPLYSDFLLGFRCFLSLP